MNIKAIMIKLQEIEMLQNFLNQFKIKEATIEERIEELKQEVTEEFNKEKSYQGVGALIAKHKNIQSQFN